MFLAQLFQIWESYCHNISAQYVTLLFLSYKAHLYTCHKSNNDYLLKLFCIICPTSPFGQPTFNSPSTQIY